MHIGRCLDRHARELWGIGEGPIPSKTAGARRAVLNDRLRRRGTPNQDLFLMMVHVKVQSLWGCEV
ncbi:MAG: hypothetical protein PVI92_09825 [Chromatiales bacterium]